MKRELFLDYAADETRAALVEDGKLCEIHAERRTKSSEAESLYYGRVQSVRPSIGAAFVDIGDELNAFLPLDDSLRIKCGDMLIVQGCAKQATDTKGLRITTKVNLAGKWLVLLPAESGVHVSKRIKGDELRSELAALGKRICPPDFGLIVRTASEDVTPQLLEDEARSLHALWVSVLKKAQGLTKPGLLHQRNTLDQRMIRDIRGIDRIVCNNKKQYETVAALQAAKKIGDKTRIEYFEEEKQLLFDAYQIEPQIDKALRKRVWLPCGGYLVIDYCEALTVIDVNSGKMILGRDLSDTALKVNMEAADEIARQLRLRDVGGIIIVDFIDMEDETHRQMLLTRMRTAASRDRSQISIEGLTRLGLMEITRKRVHASLHKHMQTGCSYCSSSSMVLAGEEVARRALRQIRRMSFSGQRGPFVIRCAPSAAQVLSAMKNPLQDGQVYCLSVSGKHAEKFDIEQIGAGLVCPKGAVPLK